MSLNGVGHPSLSRATVKLDERRVAERVPCLAHATGEVVWDLDLETCDFWWNENTTHLFGLTIEEGIANQDWLER
jgi:hypothetical protein